MSRIIVARSERQRRGTRGGRNLLPGLRRRSAKADGKRERIPDPDELPVARPLPLQSRMAYSVDRIASWQAVPPGRRAPAPDSAGRPWRFQGDRWPHRSAGRVECHGVRPGVRHSVPVGGRVCAACDQSCTCSCLGISRKL